MKDMKWLNEPADWDARGGEHLSMFVTPQSDFWRETHYGFTVDDGPFCYAERGGEFGASVCLDGEYQDQFDQMGLMLRIDARNWIKAGVEYVDKKMNLSAVVTREKSDWSMIPLAEAVARVWLKVTRRKDAVEIQYSLNGIDYTTMRLAYFPDRAPVMVGMFAASPNGQGFHASFESFQITHLPDMRRLAWLKSQSV